MSVCDPQILTTEALIFAASPAQMGLSNPVETVASRLTVTPARSHSTESQLLHLDQH